MPIINCHVDDKTHAALEKAAKVLDREIVDLTMLGSVQICSVHGHYKEKGCTFYD